MSRKHPPLLPLVLGFGVLLIGVGLLRDRPPSPSTYAATGSRSTHRDETGPSSRAPTIIVVARHASDATPAAGAVFRLWRRATGEGVTFRRARRIGPLAVTDESGRVAIDGRSGVALEIVGQAVGNGPTIRVPIAPLGAGESRRIEIVVERPPAPTRVVVRSAEGSPLVGASIWAVREARPEPTTFPGPQRDLLRRTDKKGIADLAGAARSYSWILVDAQGYSPVALSAASFQRSTRPLNTADRMQILAVTLSRAAELSMEVTATDGTSARQSEVRVAYALDGLPITSSHWTNHRGATTLRGLPAGVPLTIEITARSASGPSYRDVVELASGVRKRMAVVLDR